MRLACMAERARERDAERLAALSGEEAADTAQKRRRAEQTEVLVAGGFPPYETEIAKWALVPERERDLLQSAVKHARGGMFVLSAAHGVGKTCGATLMARAMLREYWGLARYTTALALMDLMMSRDQDRDSAIAMLRNAPLLVLDELGVGDRYHENARARFELFLGHRYSSFSATTILCTNAANAAALIGSCGTAVGSRLGHDRRVTWIVWDDQSDRRAGGEHVERRRR